MDRFLQDDLHIATRIERQKSLAILGAISQQRFVVTHVFKDDHRTYIVRIELEGDAFMYKIPKGRYNRRWERFLTLFRDGEVLRHFESMDTLINLGFKAPEPVIAVEKRQGGMAVDGFLLYRFAEGAQADKSHAALVTPQLLRLHSMGYLRRDAHAKNYLIDGNDEVIFIDFRLKQPKLLKQLRLQIELSNYLRTMPDGWNYLPEHLRKSMMLRFSVWLSSQLRDVRYLRRRLNDAARKLASRF